MNKLLVSLLFLSLVATADDKTPASSTSSQVTRTSCEYNADVPIQVGVHKDNVVGIPDSNIGHIINACIAVLTGRPNHGKVVFSYNTLNTKN